MRPELCRQGVREPVAPEERVVLVAPDFLMLALALARAPAAQLRIEGVGGLDGGGWARRRP
eukprot:6644272-Pyramimonas_sp.AAC.1